jgi:threonine/homoserine/homoserine lactone efflux protein
MQEIPAALSVLTVMITPAVLISACGTLIFSTATRLGRIVDRVRELSRVIEQLCAGMTTDFVVERRAEAERQLAAHAQRSRLIQGALTSFYISLGFFVATTVSIGLIAVVGRAQWLPSLLGIVGTVVLFYGCMLLIAETRLALRSVNAEMQFILALPDLYQARRKMAEEGRSEVEERNSPTAA